MKKGILWDVYWKDWCWSWNSNTLATWWEELTHLKSPWCWKRLKVRGEGDDRGWDGWMASPIQWTWVWVNSGDGEGQGDLECCSPWGRKALDTTKWLNWTSSNTRSNNYCHFKVVKSISNFSIYLHRLSCDMKMVVTFIINSNKVTSSTTTMVCGLHE